MKDSAFSGSLSHSVAVLEAHVRVADDLRHQRLVLLLLASIRGGGLVPSLHPCLVHLLDLCLDLDKKNVLLAQYTATLDIS